MMRLRNPTGNPTGTRPEPANEFFPLHSLGICARRLPGLVPTRVEGFFLPPMAEAPLNTDCEREPYGKEN